MNKITTILASMFVACVAIDSDAAPGAFHDAVTADAPVLHYQLNEPTGPAINYGSLGSDFDATYFGTPARAVRTSSGDGGVSFDGVDDYLESLMAAPMILAGNPRFTAEAVVRVPPAGIVSNYAPFLHWGDSTNDATMKSAYFSFHFNEPSVFYAGFYNGGLQTETPVAPGDWYHVVWVRTGGTPANQGSTFYVNGQPVALIDDPVLGFNSSAPDILPTAFRVNRAQDFTRYFVGTLDEVALYDYELDAEAVATHYAALDVCPAQTCLDADGVCKDCALPITSGATPTASDALAVLNASVGLRECALCVCDVDASGAVVALDALLVLRAAVGEPIALTCS
jgi:hypothetical protein